MIFKIQIGQEAWGKYLEIALLAVGIYYLLMFVRRTRAWPVVIGFLVLLLLLVATSVFDFKVLSHILKEFFSVSLIAIILVFHPEIRRILANLGTLPSFPSVRKQRSNIEVLIQTVDRLSSVKIGALIALEQRIDLTEIVESGVAVGCDATAEMLETIFFPNNAIHDGGVIIKGDRIERAACIFPLTNRRDLSRSLGTRHRAAVGISEESDAIVIVVSEQTGMISYAHRGQLVRGITTEELRAFLTLMLVKSSQTSSGPQPVKPMAPSIPKSPAPTQGAFR